MLAGVTGRENQGKAASLADFGADPDGEIEFISNPLDEVEPHPGRLGGLVTIVTGKAVLEDSLLVGRGDAHPLVADNQGVDMPGEGDCAAGG